MTLAYLSTAFSVLALILGCIASTTHVKATQDVAIKWMRRCVVSSMFCLVCYGAVIDYERGLVQHAFNVIP